MLRKRLLAIFMSCALILSVAPMNVFAMENNIHDNDVVLTNNDMENIEQLESFGVDVELVTKLLTVSKYIKFNADQKTLRVDLSDDVLEKEYGFTVTQLKDFNAILAGTYQSSNIGVNTTGNIITTRSAARFYLSNNDLQAGTFAVLATAAQAGPAALMAAWTSISTALAGPLGIIVGMSTAVLGSIFFADLALKITGALVQGKGVAFYLDWGIPPVTTAIE